jgi:hypothetical protein
MLALLVISIIFNIVFFVALCFAAYYLIKFARIILLTEDTLSDAIESFNKTNESINDLTKLEMFFDSPEVKRSVQRVVEDIKLSQIEITKVINNFTNLSKQKYVTVVSDE